jgi:acetyl-CoA synthetase
MSAADQFAKARAALLENHGDSEAAARAFKWPRCDTFNWVDDWFDTFATGNHKLGLVVVSNSGIVELTFDQLVERSKRLARYMHEEHVRRGDRLLLMLTNTAPLWDVMLACIRLGVVIIPATAQLTSDDIDDRIQRGEVKHVVTDAGGALKVRNHEGLKVKLVVGGTAPGFTPYDVALMAAPTPPRTQTRGSDPLFLYFTSGTTAKPKLVMHTHESYPIGHLSTMFWIGLRENDVHQNISSPGWAKHAWSSFFAPWNAGATIVAHEFNRFSAQKSVAVLHTHEVTTLCAPPTVWRMLILDDLGPKPAALRELVSAGEPLNPEIVSRVRDAWNITVRDGYGQTETSAQIGNLPGGVIKPGSMGKPLPGYTVALLDASGAEVGEGEIALKLGEARPLSLMSGYMDDAKRTMEVMNDGYYRTGDIAMRDDDGYMFFIGRADDVFKSSDYRISPFELESVLLEHEMVAEAAVVPSPDAVRLYVPKAFVTLKPGVTPSVEIGRSILSHCRARLAPYKRVRRLEFADLPKTISGKIRRVELRRDEMERRAAGQLSEEHTLNDINIIDPAATVRGISISATIGAFGLLPAVGKTILMRHGFDIDALTSDDMLPVSRLIAALEEIRQLVGLEALHRAGVALAKTVKPAKELKTVEDVLLNLDAIYHAHHTGDVGHYRARKIGDNVIEVRCETPYPPQFEHGIVEGFVRHFAGRKKYDIDFFAGDGIEYSCVIIVRKR